MNCIFFQDYRFLICLTGEDSVYRILVWFTRHYKPDKNLTWKRILMDFAAKKTIWKEQKQECQLVYRKYLTWMWASIFKRTWSPIVVKWGSDTQWILDRTTSDLIWAPKARNRKTRYCVPDKYGPTNVEKSFIKPPRNCPERLMTSKNVECELVFIDEIK